MTEIIDLELIKPYSKNSRVHNKDQVKQIADSITRFGFVNPIIIDENNTILAGHGRYMAAKELSIQSVPVVKVECLTETEKKAYIIADNKLTLNSDWDMHTLTDELNAILESQDPLDLTLTGFSEKELSALLGGGANNTTGVETGNFEEDEEYQLLVKFDSEEELQEWFESLSGKGLEVKIL